MMAKQCSNVSIVIGCSLLKLGPIISQSHGRIWFLLKLGPTVLIVVRPNISLIIKPKQNQQWRLQRKYLTLFFTFLIHSNRLLLLHSHIHTLTCTFTHSLAHSHTHSQSHLHTYIPTLTRTFAHELSPRMISKYFRRYHFVFRGRIGVFEMIVNLFRAAVNVNCWAASI